MSSSSRFGYHTTASLVTRQDRSGAHQGEPTGEAERVTTEQLQGEMGVAITEKKKTKPSRPKTATIPKSHKQDGGDFGDDDIDNLSRIYQPQTRITRRAWEELLGLVAQHLTDIPRDVLLSAAEETLITMKNPDMTARDRRQILSTFLGVITDEAYKRLLDATGAITDYITPTTTTRTEEDGRGTGDEPVAVLFDEDEDDDAAENDRKFQSATAVTADDEQLADEVQDTSSTTTSDASDTEEIGGIAQQHIKQDKTSRMDIVTTQVAETTTTTTTTTLDPRLVDSFFLQRELSKYTTDTDEARFTADRAFEILQDDDENARENGLVELLGFERFDVIKLLLNNRDVVVWCTRLGRAVTPQDKAEVETQMQQSAQGQRIFSRLHGVSSDATTTTTTPEDDLTFTSKKKSKKRQTTDTTTQLQVTTTDSTTTTTSTHRPTTRTPSTTILNLKSLSTVGVDPHAAPTTRLILPKGSWKREAKGFDEVYVRPLQSRPFAPGETLVEIKSLPVWMQAAFLGMEQLNRVQSRVYPAALHPHNFNMLVCAPTGSGKTNVAMLVIMNEVSKFVDPNTNKVDTARMRAQLKMVYVAPMKALVQEVVMNFSGRLTQAYGITVRELSGDQQLSKAEIADTQLIVTTPEKWDVFTRKAGDRAYTHDFRLLIVDEIHLLHDLRGAVLEAVIARTLRASVECKESVRILGISATLPNFADVASFLRVPLDQGLFFFDNSYRPIPLQQLYVGVSEKKAVARMQLIDRICFEKVSASVKDNQVLVFVHTRKDTVKTAKFLRDEAQTSNTLSDFLPPAIHSREVLLTMAETEVKSRDLKELLPFGIAVHHAGMARSDRTLVEDLFRNRQLRVLISTATLAWGVNLPAHTVIIKGTQVYDPQQSQWTELSQLDVLQMLGRAGRPQFDAEGEGIIITSHHSMHFYLSLLNEQLPVESQLAKHLTDHVNAEVVCGAIQNLADASRWLSYTYLYVRALKDPVKYGVVHDDKDDPTLEQWRIDLAHAAALELSKLDLIRYDIATGTMSGTQLGRVASHYYLSPNTASTLVSLLDPSCSDVELLRILSAADEFKQLSTRQEEKLEVSKLLERVPVPVKETVEDPAAKTIVLLQAYISNVSLEGYALACDSVYIHQSAGRISRAMFEICLLRGWGAVSRRALEVNIMIQRQIWRSQTPLRQFPGALTGEVLNQLEKKNIAWSHFGDYSPEALGAMVRQPRLGGKLHRLVHLMPKLAISALVQPLTRNTLRVKLSLTADFEFDEDTHGSRQMVFWILCEDCDGESLLHSEQFVLKARFREEEHFTAFTVHIPIDPAPAFLLVRVVSDRFLHATSTVPLNLMAITLPPPPSTATPVLDMAPVTIKSLPANERDSFQACGVTTFWPTQTQVFQTLRGSDVNALVCMPVGKTICAEFAIFRMFEIDPDARVVYLNPAQHKVDAMYARWQQFIGYRGKSIVKLAGIDAMEDLAVMSNAHIVLATAKQYETLSRRWKQKSRKVVTEISLLVLDDLHVGWDAADRSVYEVVVSRLRYAATQLGKTMRVVALSYSLAAVEDMAGWLDCKQHVFNFSPSARPYTLEIQIRGFPEIRVEDRLQAMAKPAYMAIRDAGPTLVFVPTKRYARMVCVDLITYATAEGRGRGLRGDGDGAVVTPHDTGLMPCIDMGVAYLHESMDEQDKNLVMELFTSSSGKVRVLVCSVDSPLPSSMMAQTVVVMGTSVFDFAERRYVEYSFHRVLAMTTHCRAPGKKNRFLLLCHDAVKAFYTKAMDAPMYVESSLHLALAHHVLNEIVSKTIESKQDAIDWITWMLLYRRVVHNPSYYGAASPNTKHLSDFLSDLVDRAVTELVEANCIKEEEQDAKLSPLNLGMIASHYDVDFTTLELFAASLQPKTKLKGAIEILSSASEFMLAGGKVRAKEEYVYDKLAKRVSLPVTQPGEGGFKLVEHVKVNLLLQAHFSRLALPSSDQKEDLDVVLRQCPTLVSCLVDTASSMGLLKPAITVMELSQMISQGVWIKDSPLKQIPGMNDALMTALKEHGVNTIYDFIDLDDEWRTKALSMANIGNEDLKSLIEFCNMYPSLQVGFAMTHGENEHVVTVTLERDGDEGERVVESNHFPRDVKKKDGWWLVVGETDKGVLHAVKKIVMKTRVMQVKLTWGVPSGDGSSNNKLKLYLISDSYCGADQEFDLE